ncbi:hypothetical protein H1164_07360 [Thermoactinomyces daqus]|uniref:Tox-REase-5 domain-containing protein n=1 Tax=Thermoactinomyces daqus TaxID=1329516 RepID=A0A7W1X9P2_9BACL|nr:hypothetical protein [Thermoactinomyces daqus]MBA4542718.1 hypothetical protein [Thermoactinomyces daqus]
MNQYFYRFVIVFLLTLVGFGMLGGGQVFASGGSFNVPHVNDHFDKVQQGPASTKETPVTSTSQEEIEHESGNWFTKTWNWTKETVFSAWNKTKEFCSESWDWICKVCGQITKVVVDGLSSAWNWIKDNIVTIGLTVGIIVLVIAAVVLIVFGGEFVLGALVISGETLGEGILAGIVISGLFSWLSGNDFLGSEMLSDMLFGGLSGGIGGVFGSYVSSSVAGSGFVSWLGSKISWLGEAFPKILGGAVGGGTGQSLFDWFKTGKVNLRNTFVATVFGGFFAFAGWSISNHTGPILSKINEIPIPKLEVGVLDASGMKIPSISFGKITVGDTEFGAWLQKFASEGSGEGADGGLFSPNGKFKDPTLESAYEKYLARKSKEGKPPRDRVNWKQARDYWLKDSPMARGNAFNKKAEEEQWYPFNEVNLSNGKRLDSYNPVKEEIVSRKATDLDTIDITTFESYLREMKIKYKPGIKIRSNKFPEIDGQPLKGKQILEIPASNRSFSQIQEYIDLAKNKYGIEIRFREE